MKHNSEVSESVCEQAGWNPNDVSESQYIALLERTFVEISDFLDGPDEFIQKNLRKLDTAGVDALKKRLAFPEGTLAVLPMANDLVLHLRDLPPVQKARLIRSLEKNIVSTSDAGMARVAKDGTIDPASVQAQAQDGLSAIDELIERTAREVERRQQNPDQTYGPTQISVRLT